MKQSFINLCTCINYLHILHHAAFIGWILMFFKTIQNHCIMNEINYQSLTTLQCCTSCTKWEQEHGDFVPFFSAAVSIKYNIGGLGEYLFCLTLYCTNCTACIVLQYRKVQQHVNGQWVSWRDLQRAVKEQTLSEFTLLVCTLFSSALQFLRKTNKNISTWNFILVQ